MNQALADLIHISNTVGKDARLVQGGGGNTSSKTADGKSMYIKASGTALKEMNARQGWRRMRVDEILAILSDDLLVDKQPQDRENEVVSRLLTACDDAIKTNARPSVEAHLHALLDKVVIHLHAQVAGAFVNAKDGKSVVEKIFRDEKLPPLWIPYVDPGLMLGRKVKSLVEGYQKQYHALPKILFLAKHGLFLTESSATRALRLTRRVIKRCQGALGAPPVVKVPKVDSEPVRQTSLQLRQAFFAATGDYAPVYHFLDESVARMLRRRDVAGLLKTHALTPDELIYTHGSAIWIDKLNISRLTRQLQDQIARGYKPATVFLVKDQGLFIVEQETNVQVVKETTNSSFFIRMAAAKMGGVNALNVRQETFINEWESEAFRLQLVTSFGLGQLRNRIAVVSGAGSGLGRSIAIGLARAGALVALADLDTAAARQTADIIQAEIPKAQTLVVSCDVTSEASVGSAFASLIDSWGGLDILVNAAGVAPAYALVDLPVDKWRLALEVNMTGYFLMAQAAARIMIAQNMGGSIINISSKSGIDASRNNTPYNATKAGELHMARGWALELGDHNIRVNNVCPGNVFEGSKIWNPTYIRTCAKKYGVKPEEVIPYYVNKTILKKEIKGQDIADSVVFLASDQARRITGQTLVTDAGQAMVR